ncbi:MULTISPECIES: SPOR domain-containing protein [Arthrobacter]|uniref:SPOR domain-containing protein n=2 Tax=Arthrobacter TaxID=1663 RepID=A0ABU9KJ25_9MICC|nr:SPOR domain-containing protein [Arthrobacter sp. YJM1]MDP5226186.1 SPOR domain-containing protein [Arthrobacter sp. YJM1]
MPKFWYNMVTHQVEEDAMSDWSQLLGPFDTREEAAKALESVRKHNEAWDKDDDD